MEKVKITIEVPEKLRAKAKKKAAKESIPMNTLLTNFLKQYIK